MGRMDGELAHAGPLGANADGGALQHPWDPAEEAVARPPSPAGLVSQEEWGPRAGM